MVTVDGTEDIMVITNKGVIIRTNVANISQTGRATLGVKIMKLDADAKIVTFTLVQPEDSSIAEINTDRENSISKIKIINHNKE